MAKKSGSKADDLLIGGDGNDQLNGGDGDDRLEGGAGNDQLFGQSDDDQLHGGAGNDKLYGNEGDDLLERGVVPALGAAAVALPHRDRRLAEDVALVGPLVERDFLGT